MIAGRQRRMFLVFGVLAAIVSTGLAQTETATDANDFKTEMDKVSYIIGAQVAGQVTANLRAQGIEVNVEMLLRGIRDAMTGQKPVLSMDQQRTIMMAFQQQMKAKQEAEAMAKLGEGNEWKLKLTKPEQRQFDPNKEYFWVLETSKGVIRIKLMPQVAPMHVSSTMFLTEKKFYDGTIFHRVIPGFMAQGGDPTGTGTGGPGYNYGSEIDPNVKHDRAFLLSMANTGRPNSDGSQFFLTFKPTPWLDGKHTIFGEVVEGQEAVQKLEASGSPQGKPTEELKIIKATIEEKAKG